MKEILLGALKLLPRIHIRYVLGTVCVSSWVVLFAPDSALVFFGLLNFRNTQHSTIGLVALISGVIVTLLLAESLWRRFCRWRSFSGYDAKRRLDALGDWNRSLVRQLYETPSHSQKLPLQSANVHALLSENVIIHSPMGDALGFDCILQPWVVQYLAKHPDYLRMIKNFDEPFTCGSQFF